MTAGSSTWDMARPSGPAALPDPDRLGRFHDGNDDYARIVPPLCAEWPTPDVPDRHTGHGGTGL